MPGFVGFADFINILFHILTLCRVTFFFHLGHRVHILWHIDTTGEQKKSHFFPLSMDKKNFSFAHSVFLSSLSSLGEPKQWKTTKILNKQQKKNRTHKDTYSL